MIPCATDACVGSFIFLLCCISIETQVVPYVEMLTARNELVAEARNISWTSLTLMWRFDVKQATYTVDVDSFDGFQFSPAHGYKPQPMQYDSDMVQFTQHFDELDPCTLYIFTVKSTDVYAGIIGYSNPVRAFTFDNSDVRASPRDVTARPLSNSTIEVSWATPFLFHNNDHFPPDKCITMFILDFYDTRLSDGRPDWSQFVWDNSARSYTVHRLLPCTNYSIKVAVVHQSPDAFALEPAMAQTEAVFAKTLVGIPGPVTQVRVHALNSSEQVCVTWVPPHGEDCVTDYEVKLKLLGECHNDEDSTTRPHPHRAHAKLASDGVVVCPPELPPTSPPETSTPTENVLSTVKSTTLGMEERREMRDVPRPAPAAYATAYVDCVPMCLPCADWGPPLEYVYLPATFNSLHEFCVADQAELDHAALAPSNANGDVSCANPIGQNEFVERTNQTAGLCLEMNQISAWYKYSVWARTGDVCGPPNIGWTVVMPTPGDAHISRIRGTQAEINWDTGNIVYGCRNSISLLVFCQAKGNLPPPEMLSIRLPSYPNITVRMRGLYPATSYTCTAKYVLRADESQCAKNITFTTAKSDNDEPVHPSLTGQDAISWENDCDFDVPYLVEATPVNMSDTGGLLPDEKFIPILPGQCPIIAAYRLYAPPGKTCCSGLRELLPGGKEWSLRVRAVGGNASEAILFSTPEKVPKPPSIYDLSPSNFMCNGTVLDSLLLNIGPPCESNGVITEYRISNNLLEPYELILSSSVMLQYYCETEGRYLIPLVELYPQFDWCSVQGKKLSTSVQVKTAQSSYSPALRSDFTIGVLDMAKYSENISAVPLSYGGALVQIPRSLFLGEPFYYAIIVTESPSQGETHRKTCETTPWTTMTYIEANRSDPMPSFRVNEEYWNPFRGVENKIERARFEIGGYDNACKENDTSYCNGPLRAGKTYAVRVEAAMGSVPIFVVSPAVFVTMDSGNPRIDAILSYVGLLALAILAVILLIQFFTKWRCWFRGDNLVPGECMAERKRYGVPPPYSQHQFRYLAAVTPCALVGPQMQREFEALSAISSQVAASTPCRVGKLPQNACKNRYSNIVPFDRNRVKLLHCADDDDVANYINASLIAGYSGKPEYIATQGPKEGTARDFWFMVYEQNVRLIIMLTKLMEDGKSKCHQYYPDEGDRFTWGDLSVACSVENDLQAYTLRTIVLEKGSESRVVHHLLFHAWPDFGCPESSAHVLHVCMTVRRHAAIFPGMMLVHCSAGVGRTGTLIALDILLQVIKAKKKIDVFGVALRLRAQRPFMVQNQGQYGFIYKCLHESMHDPTLYSYKAPFVFPRKMVAQAAVVHAVGMQTFKKILNCRK